jgi:hypothetical protein
MFDDIAHEITDVNNEWGAQIASCDDSHRELVYGKIREFGTHCLDELT